MPLPVSQIGDWTTTQLVKFIKDILENTPLKNLKALIVGDLKVTGTLAIDGPVAFGQNQAYHLIAATGEPPFQNAWGNWGAPQLSAGYLKDPLGFVHLQGVIKSGTVGAVAFNLPPGLRPPATVGPFAVVSNGGLGAVQIASTGDVTIAAPSSNVYVVLDGIHFQAS